MNLLEISISASVMILIVLLVRILGKKYISKTVIMVLWDLILIRALLPFQISLENIPLLKQSYQRFMVAEVPLASISFDQSAIQVSTNLIKEAGNPDGVLQIEALISALWLVGAVCLFINFGRIYRRERRALRKCLSTRNETAERLIRSLNLHRKVQLYEGTSFISPVTYGVLCPKIIIPGNLEAVSRVDMRNMIAHELVHIRRYDVVKRFFLVVVLCVHWFNPLMWVMYHYYGLDQEMACDEKVLKEMTGKEAKNYVYTMIKMATDGRMLWSTNGFVGRSAERKRILAAMNQRKMGKGSALAVAVLCLFLISPFFSLTQDVETPEFLEKVEAPQSEKLEASPKEPTLLSPFYEGEIWSIDMENFDYKGVMQDIIENHNDVNQPFTDDQVKAMNIKNYITIANIFKRRQDRGEKLDATELWILDEFYKYGE